MGVAKGQKIRNTRQKTKSTLEKNYDEFHNSLLNLQKEKTVYTYCEIIRQCNSKIATTLLYDKAKIQRLNKPSMRLWFQCSQCSTLDERTIHEIMTWPFRYKIACKKCQEPVLRAEIARENKALTRALCKKRSGV